MASNCYVLAQKGKIFVLTSKGYEHCKRFCKETVLRERKIGKPVGEYADSVPHSWIEHGWVEERKSEDVEA